MATLKDIAMLAGVNTTTVSKALRDCSDVNQDTAQRIKKLAREMGYQSRSQRAKKTEKRPVLILCQELTTDSYTRMIFAAEQSLRKKGYRCVVMVSNFDLDYELGALRHMTPNVSGVIYTPIPISEGEQARIQEAARAAVAKHGTPIVMMNASACYEDFDTLNKDECAGYRQAIERLKLKGHERFAFISDRYGDQRLNDFKGELNRAGLDIPAALCFQSDALRHFECGYEQAGLLLRRDKRPTAIFAQYDDIAVGVMSRIRDEGLSVPDDCAVLGFDESRYCKYQSPPLASIDFHAEDMAAVATSILAKKMENRHFSMVQAVTVKSSLVVRASIGWDDV